MSGQPTPTVAVSSNKAEHYELCRSYFTDGTTGVSQGVGLMTLINRGMQAWLMEEAKTPPYDPQGHTSSQIKYDANDLVIILASALGGVVNEWQ